MVAGNILINKNFDNSFECRDSVFYGINVEDADICKV